MTKQDLMKFCSVDRENLKEPFSRGDFTYATNGHIAVRIPRLPDVPENSDAPSNIEILFEKYKGSEYYPIPDVPPIKKVACYHCDGVGHFKKGNKLECEKCCGTGKITGRESFIASGRHYDKKYLFILRDLPNCELSYAPSTDIGHFKFDDGDGLLMPMRW